MSINKRIIIILSIFFIGTIVVTLTISNLVIQKRFLGIEEQTVSTNINRVINMLSNDKNGLSYLNIDWSAWDDTYEFIDNGNKNYIDSNLVDSTFTNLNLNLIMFVNLSGNIVYEKGFDIKSEEETLISEDMHKYIFYNGILVNNIKSGNSISGIVLLPENPMLIASEPILTSNNEGPMKGALIFGRYFDESAISSLAKKTELSIDVFRLDRPDEFNELSDVSSKINDENPFYITTLDSKNIAGYTVLEDIFGHPALLLRINMTRDIYRQSMATLVTFASIIFAVCILLGAMTLILLNKTFLKRLLELGNDVRRIGKEKDISKRVATKGNDEISVLANDINSMLNNIEKTQDKVKYMSFHDSLTGLYNRAYFEEELRRLDTKRYLPLSIVIGDINGVKLINETLGYEKGDELINKISKILKNCFRTGGIIARWGCGEFIIVLPNTVETDTLKIIERTKKSCKKNSSKTMPLSISIGVFTKINSSQNIEDIIKKAEDMMYGNKLIERQSARSSIISSLEKTLEERDYETKEHVKRMKFYAKQMGKKLKLPAGQLDELNLLAALHDIGKIATADSIILKPGKLNDEEWKLIKKHPETGYRIAQSSLQLVPISKAILTHHENWDGSGYPNGLRKNEIPFISRIISIVDAYDAMTSDRPYRKAMSEADAINELKRCSGTQFDPDLVKFFIDEVLSSKKTIRYRVVLDSNDFK